MTWRIGYVGVGNSVIERYGMYVCMQGQHGALSDLYQTSSDLQADKLAGARPFQNTS